MSFHGIQLPANGDAGCGVGGLGPLREDGAQPQLDDGGSPTSNRTFDALRGPPSPRSGHGSRMNLRRSPSHQSEVSRAVSTTSLDSRTSRTSRLSRMRTALSRLTRRQPARPSFHGQWACIGTWGLDDFLKENGISKMQRMAASKAPWPSWEFQQDGDHIVFINHSFLGDITEEFEVGGPEYTAIDGKKQKLQCKAFWEDETLVIERSGPQGRFKEERALDGEGRLQFTLTSLDKASSSSWGRTFAKK